MYIGCLLFLFCSPFQFRVVSVHDARKVRVSGPGLLSGQPASLPAHFSVDTTEAGEGELSVEIVVSYSRNVLVVHRFQLKHVCGKIMKCPVHFLCPYGISFPSYFH